MSKAGQFLRTLNRPEKENVVRKDNPDDYTGNNASNRTFYVNLRFMKYGTSDRFQGAAIFLSVILLFLWMCIAVLGIWHHDWSNELMGKLSPILTLVVGVAVGSAAKSKKDDN